MEEKIKESLSFLDEMNQKSKEEKNKQWTTTIEIAKMIRVKTIDRPLSLWGRIKQRLYTSWEYPRLILRSQDPLWSILDSDCCKLLSVMNSSETYKPHPPARAKNNNSTPRVVKTRMQWLDCGLSQRAANSPSTVASNIV